MLNVPHDLNSCVLVTPMHEILWKGHSNSAEALRMMQKTEAFALLNRHGTDNPYTDIDFSGFESAFNISENFESTAFGSYPKKVREQAEEEIHAFLDGKIGYRVHNGILKVQELDDPDSCVLEVLGCVMWYGNVFSDEAHAMIAASQEVVELRPTPVALIPLQA